MSKQRGIANVLQKLRTSVEDAKYYDAHQMYRTLYYRYSGGKKKEDALVLVTDGAQLLLKHGQIGSGADLGMLVIELYESMPKDVSTETLDQALSVFHAFESPCAQREKYMKALAKWSSTAGGPSKGDPRIYAAWGTQHMQEGTFDIAHNKFLHANADTMPLFAILLVEKSSTHEARDQDLILAVVQLLCLDNMLVANALVKAYLAETKAEAPHTDHVDFVRFLLRVCERDAHPLFRILLEKYKTFLKAIPGVPAGLQRIEGQYFNVKTPAQQQQQANPMAAMMSQMMGGGGGANMMQMMQQMGMGGMGGPPPGGARRQVQGGNRQQQQRRKK